MDVNNLNNSYQYLSPLMRFEKLFDSYDHNKILVTSSFGTTSAVLLHHVQKVSPGHIIHFIDTGFHFKETEEYIDKLSSIYELTIRRLSAAPNRHVFTKNNQTYQLNPDLCCHINKVMPVDELKEKHSIWISGVLRFQNATRKDLPVFQQTRNIVKFHPILDMTEKEVALYSFVNGLPEHPLLAKGYQSVGCMHCTSRGIGRHGRWAGTEKVECGLHA